MPRSSCAPAQGSASLHPLLRLLLLSWSAPVEGRIDGLTVCTRAQLGLSL